MRFNFCFQVYSYTYSDSFSSGQPLRPVKLACSSMNLREENKPLLSLGARAPGLRKLEASVLRQLDDADGIPPQGPL